MVAWSPGRREARHRRPLRGFSACLRSVFRRVQWCGAANLVGEGWVVDRLRADQGADHLGHGGDRSWRRTALERPGMTFDSSSKNGFRPAERERTGLAIIH